MDERLALAAALLLLLSSGYTLGSGLRLNLRRCVSSLDDDVVLLFCPAAFSFFLFASCCSFDLDEAADFTRGNDTADAVDASLLPLDDDLTDDVECELDDFLSALDDDERDLDDFLSALDDLDRDDRDERDDDDLDDLDRLLERLVDLRFDDDGDRDEEDDDDDRMLFSDVLSDPF